MKRLNQQLNQIKGLFDKSLVCTATTAQTLTTAAGITPPTGTSLADYNYVIVQADNQTSPATVTGTIVRYCTDGTTPSSTVGNKMNDGEAFDIVGPTNLSKIKLIKIGADTVVLQISFFK